MSRDIRQAEKAALASRFDLLIARAMQESYMPGRRQQGRDDSRTAKRRRARSNRRIGKLICRDYA